MTTNVRPAPDGADSGFHEIQLSAKQLVFLFIATTVVSIVIFLCGVLVGRGTRVEPVVLAEQGVAPPVDLPTGTTASPAAAAPGPGAAGPPTQIETNDLQYLQMLRAEQPANTVPQPPAEEPVVVESAGSSGPVAGPGEQAAPSASASPAAAGERLPMATAGAATGARAGAVTDPSAAGFTIQVAAFKQRSEADRVARRLRAKGYEAFVADPAPGTSMFRVRVGRFTDRAEAERVKTRLAREERFKPWITR